MYILQPFDCPDLDTVYIAALEKSVCLFEALGVYGVRFVHHNYNTATALRIWSRTAERPVSRRAVCIL